MNSSSTKIKHILKRVFLVIIILAAGFIGYYLPHEQKTANQSIETTAQHDHGSPTETKPQIWTCSMHPQIKLPNPGKCPICFMELIPLNPDEAGSKASDIQFVMSEEAKKLAEVQTAEVKREQAKVNVRMVGLVYEDETRVASLTSRIDGRLDEVYINFTGVHVRQGDPMVKIWSPTLIKSQVELFETLKSETDPGVIKGAEEKLIQYGLTKEQIQQIRDKKKPDLYITLKAPINGVVTKKSAVLGQFVKEGQEMYTINDLSYVWIKLDAYEPDLPWIKYGQDVTFTTPAVPGKKFKGKVLFIDPVLDTKTRSVKIRVDAENPDFLLKPGMFVSAEIESEVDAFGKVIKSEWTGKYICPIHPRDIVSDKPGICPDSKMELRPATSFGYSDEKDPRKPLVVPVSAPLITGTRTIVYVEVPGDKPTYELREITLGPKAGDKYLVYDGLREGDRVVTKGNFKIDSAMQILGKQSMMSEVIKKPKQQEEQVVKRLSSSPEFLHSLSPVIEQYMSLKNALVSGNASWAGIASQHMHENLMKVNENGMDNKSLEPWSKSKTKMMGELSSISKTDDISLQRSSFDAVSEELVKTLMAFRHALPEPLYVYFCQAAAGGNGAYWLEQTKDFTNPYFGIVSGSEQEVCGELQDTIPSERKSIDTNVSSGAANGPKPAHSH